MPKISHFRKPEFTLGELGIEAMLTQLGESEAKMLRMLFFGLGIDKNIIQIDHHKLVKVFHEDRVHESRESCWGIGEAKGHDCVLIESIASSESCLWNILFANFDLMVTASQVQLREHHGTCQLIKEIIYSRKGILILDRLLV
jgi:hypothetical protein